MIESRKMIVTCLDFEGVLIPEIWEGLAHSTNIDDFKLTTRDISDYSELMNYRLKIFNHHNLTLRDIQKVTAKMEPLEGALKFLSWLRKSTEVIILSDTFREFVKPLIQKLNYPTIFCHSLKLDENFRIVDYCLRQSDQKRSAVKALKSLNFKTIAVGDSYNDLGMLYEADYGIFFRPKKKIIEEYPEFPVTYDYASLKSFLIDVK